MKSGYEIIAYVRESKVKGRDPFNQNFRNLGPKLNGSVWSNRKSFEKTGPPFEVDHFSRSDRLEFWLKGSRHMEIAQSKYCTQSGFISQLTGLDSGSQSLVGSGLFHLGCIPDSKAQDSRFHKKKYIGRTYFTGTYVFQ